MGREVYDLSFVCDNDNKEGVSGWFLGDVYDLSFVSDNKEVILDRVLGGMYTILVL